MPIFSKESTLFKPIQFGLNNDHGSLRILQRMRNESLRSASEFYTLFTG